MRKFALIALTVSVTCALVATAFAQYSTPPVVTVTGSVDLPKFKPKPKTKKAKKKAAKKAKNATLNVKFDVNAESNTTLNKITYAIPPSIKLNGTGFKTCSADAINQSGESVCPKGSQVGTGAATALLGPGRIPLTFTVSVYNSGAKSLALYLKTSLFTIAIPATITGQDLSFDLPKAVYSPVTNLYSYVTSVTANIGDAKVKTGKGKKRKTRFYATQKKCKSKTHAFGVTLGLQANPDPPPSPTASGATTSPCKKF